VCPEFLPSVPPNCFGPYFHLYFCGKLEDFASFWVFKKLDVSVQPNFYVMFKVPLSKKG